MSRLATQHLIRHEQHLWKRQRFLEFLCKIIHLRIAIFDIQIHFQEPKFQANIKSPGSDSFSSPGRTVLAFSASFWGRLRTDARFPGLRLQAGEMGENSVPAHRVALQEHGEV